MITTGYIAPKGSDHMMEEERQWLEIVSDPNPIKAMLLVFIQKLCSAFHELAPAVEKGAVKNESIPYIAHRLVSRADSVIERLKLNGLLDIDGAKDLVDLRDRLGATENLSDIVEMSEEVHLINHRLCDALIALREAT